MDKIINVLPEEMMILNQAQSNLSRVIDPIEARTLANRINEHYAFINAIKDTLGLMLNGNQDKVDIEIEIVGAIDTIDMYLSDPNFSKKVVEQADRVVESKVKPKASNVTHENNVVFLFKKGKDEK